MILVLASAACDVQEPGQSGDGTITVIEGKLEQDWRVAPELLATVDGYTFVFDHLDKELLVYDGDVALDSSRLNEVASKHAGVSKALERFGAESFAAGDNRLPKSEFRRQGDSRGHVNLSSKVGEAMTLDVEALAGGYLADAWLLRELPDAYFAPRPAPSCFRIGSRNRYPGVRFLQMRSKCWTCAGS